MKIVQTAPWAETSGSLATNKFQISNNPVIFEILRSKIYQDPIGSICREIASNARDAHREVGTPEKPIQVHLPTSLDPNLRIRDFGPGISPERVDRVFRIYGESSKRLNNDELGGFGLGAKTPYSYTDSWSVNTYIDKIKRVYHCYIDDTLSGDMVLMSETKTKEPNGTEIVVPVTSSIDYNRFRDAMLKWTAFWPVKPQFVGVNFDKPEQLPEEFKKYKNISKPNISTEKYDLYISPSRSYGYSNWLQKGVFAVIDGLVYNIDLYQSKLNNVYRSPDISLHLKFEIGEFTANPFTAGRESLQYNDPTILAIRKRFEEVWPQIVNNLQTHIDALESYREALQFIDAMGLTYSKFTWRGFELQRSFNMEDLCPDQELAKQLKIYLYRSTYKGISRSQSGGHFSVGYEGFAMFFNDTFKKTMLPRYLEDHFFKESGARSFYYFSWAHDYDGDRSLDFIPEKFRQAFQIQELSKLTLPEPKVEEKEERVLIRSNPTHFRAMQIRMSNRAVCNYVIEPSLFDRTIPCFHLMMEENKHIKLGLKWFDGEDLSSISQFLKTYSNYSNFNLAIFTGEKQKKQAEKDGAKLIDLNEEMKKILDKEVENHALSLEDLFFYDDRYQFGYSKFNHLKNLFYDSAGEIVPFSELGELWEYFLYSNEVENLIEEHKLLLYWLRKFYSDEGLTKKPKLQEYAEKDWSKYLLLDSLGYIPDNHRELLRQQLRNYAKSLSS